MNRFYEPAPPVLYFAYGSNLDARQMRERCPGARRISKATLRGVRLSFAGYSATRRGPVATLVASPKEHVEGILYSVPADEMVDLDRHEGAPRFYQRCAADVETSAGKRRKAQTYVLTEAAARQSPDPGYLKIIQKAYRRLGFDEKRLRQIASSR